jgi:hypothetical protein
MNSAPISAQGIHSTLELASCGLHGVYVELRAQAGA